MTRAGSPEDRATADTWDAEVYERYADERSRPLGDLMTRVGAVDPALVVDLGCGTGSGLRMMARRWPSARLIGVDSSADMLETAAAELAGSEAAGGDGGDSGVLLVRAQAESWEPDAAVDVLLSNALLQWIPDHPALLSRMAGWLAPDGWLAIQVPGNFDRPSHTLLRQLAESSDWATRLGGLLRGPESSLPAEGYFRILANAGLVVDAWETTYLHVLTGSDPVLAWTRGTALRPVLAALSDDEAPEFSGQYAALLRDAYPADRAGRVLFRFRRIFAVGHREGPR